MMLIVFQGSYSAQNYETSTSAYVVPLPNPPQGEGKCMPSVAGQIFIFAPD